MGPLVAIDIAILPPDEVARRAIELSAALPDRESQGLRLGADMLPHVTLLQQFVLADELPSLLDGADRVLRECGPVRLYITGGGKGSGRSVWMALDRGDPVVDLHERLLHAAAAFDAADGGPSAFFNGDARERDVRWVRDYRRASSGAAFMPHITLGHAEAPPKVEPIDFVATTVAACHLGRFCTCQRVIRAWELRSQ